MMRRAPATCAHAMCTICSMRHTREPVHTKSGSRRRRDYEVKPCINYSLGLLKRKKEIERTGARMLVGLVQNFR